MEYIEFSLDDLDIRDCEYDLTIAMIVKNEEEYLEKCLKSLAPLREKVNCELIITDTGSTDSTIEIAQKYADKVLHFDWCNDFSEARNTGVEESEGRWFMFIDADEVFDESIDEIANFINSPDCDSYDSATYIVRNVKDDERKSYNDFKAPRLYNFNKKKRPFTFKIHETIPLEGEVCQLDGVAWHVGYQKENFAEKRVRNRAILEGELANEPNNVRYIKQMMDITENVDEKISLGHKAIFLCKNGKGTNPTTVLYIYGFLARIYLSRNEYDKILEITDDFLNIKLQDNKILPHLEMLWFSSIAANKLGRTADAIRKLEAFTGLYEYLSQNPDLVYGSMGVYYSNKQSVFYEVLLNLIDNLHKIGEFGKASRLLEIIDVYKYTENDEYVFLNLYLTKVIKLNRRDLFSKVLTFIKSEKIDIYVDSRYSIVLLGKMHFQNNILDFVQNCDKDIFEQKILTCFKGFDLSVNLVFEHLVKKVNFSTKKELEMYSDLSRIYMLHVQEIIQKSDDEYNILIGSQNKMQDALASSGLFSGNTAKNDKVDAKSDMNKNKLNAIFELFVHLNYGYINKNQKISELKEKGLDKIPNLDAMTIVVYDKLVNKNKNIEEYIKTLNIALSYAEELSPTVNIAINLAKK